MVTHKPARNAGIHLVIVKLDVDSLTGYMCTK